MDEYASYPHFRETYLYGCEVEPWVKAKSQFKAYKKKLVYFSILVLRPFFISKNNSTVWSPCYSEGWTRQSCYTWHGCKFIVHSYQLLKLFYISSTTRNSTATGTTWRQRLEAYYYLLISQLEPNWCFGQPCGHFSRGNATSTYSFSDGIRYMRAAGCAINDFADRKVDGNVQKLVLWQLV